MLLNYSGGLGSSSNLEQNCKYEYMSKNLSMRLNQMSTSPLGLSQGNESMLRHDLFEIDRKRKFLLAEVESIQKRKYEELEGLKRIEARKDAMLKELATAQEAIEKQRLFMKQLEKEMNATKSR